MIGQKIVSLQVIKPYKGQQTDFTRLGGLMDLCYVGDPCYVLNDDLFELLVQAVQRGEREVQIGEHTILFQFTDRGDGSYKLVHQNTPHIPESYLAVDSGTLSIIPTALIDSPANLKQKDNELYTPRKYMGKVLSIPKTLTVADGEFTFGGIYMCDTSNYSSVILW